MVKEYHTVYLGGQGEITEKKSRFIATVEYTPTEQEALDFIERMRKKYWDARHNCYAYVIGKENPLMRCSDDGEPSGTAGRPMLDVLTGRELTDICVVVTRYFGGVLLGTGGLVRAYTQSTVQGLEESVLIRRRLADQLRIGCDYGHLGKIQYLAAQAGYKILDSEYADDVTLTVLTPVDDTDRFVAGVTEGTSGQARIAAGRQLYYAEAQGEILLFED